LSPYDAWKTRVPDEYEQAEQLPEHCWHELAWDECEQCQHMSIDDILRDLEDMRADWLADE
jgi:hypothetical protein